MTTSYTNAWQGAVVSKRDCSTMFFIDVAVALISLIVIPFLWERRARTRAPSAGAPLPEAS